MESITGAAAGMLLTTTLRVCVATPATLLAVNVKVCVPVSFVGAA